MDSLTLAISQGSLRRGSAACYLDISHPEIEEFLEIRKPSGDFNRKALNLHHGVLITDEFMEAVRDGAEWTLRSPKDGSERATVDARALFQKLVETRLATGEPYIVFSDTVNRMMPKHHRELGPQGLDLEPVLGDHAAHRPRPSRQRSHRGLLPVLAQPRDLGRVERRQELHRGRHALPRQCAAGLHRPRARRDGARQVFGDARALGRPGRDGLPLASCRRAASPSKARWPRRWNLKMFKHIARQADEASMHARARARPLPRRRRHGRDGALQLQDGDRADRVDLIICGGTSACIEPIPANIYTHKTLSGSFVDQEPLSGEAARPRSRRIRRNVWNSILEQGGSVQHLDFLSQEEKDVLQDQLRDRPALAARTRRRPHALYRPGAVAEPVHPGRRRQVGPADAPLPRLGAGHQVALLPALEDRCSAPASPAGSRRTTPPTSADRARRADGLRGMPGLPVRWVRLESPSPCHR